MTSERMKALIADYGRIAVGTYFGLFFATMAGFMVAISLGVAVEGVASGAGLVGAAWVATKVTMPLRIAATALLTPLVARVIRWRSPPKPEVPRVSSGGAVIKDERAE